MTDATSDESNPPLKNTPYGTSAMRRLLTAAVRVFRTTARSRARRARAGSVHSGVSYAVNAPESSKKQRQVQLDAYFRELSEFPLPGHLFEHLAVFLELNVYVACTSEQPAEVDVQLAEREARSAFSVTPAKCWNPSFMSADPLALNDEEPPSVAAGLVEGAEEVAGNKVICEASEGLLRHAPTLQFKHIGSVPAFLSQSSRRSYPPTGEGLRVSAHT